ncbi:DUF192 domain-containing protein [Thermoproteota archaeon]
MKRPVFLITFFTTIILFIFVSLSSQGSPGYNDQVCLNGSCFNVDVADTPEKRQQGLMFRESLGRDEGMLFVFEVEDIYDFWMKNTYIPLDIIWINSNREVVFIEYNAMPCGEDECLNILPDSDALYVLELNAGIVQKVGLSLGDVAQISLHSNGAAGAN